MRPLLGQDLVENLYNERDPKAFEKAHADALKQGVSKQVLVESRFLFIIDTGDHAAIADFLPVLEAQALVYSPEESMAFPLRENFLAIVEYTRAIAALENNEPTKFKEHITEAFWLSPAQSGFFGQLIDKVRLRQKMAELTLDMSRAFSPQNSQGKAQPLQAHLGKSPALLLHFWSPWSRESLDSMPDFYLTARTLKKNGIPSLSILPTSVPESQLEANRFITEEKNKTQVPWFIDSATNSLESVFRIQAFPTVVLISQKGKILFNGHPGNPLFWTALQKISPEIEQPQSAVREPQKSPEKE